MTTREERAEALAGLSFEEQVDRAFHKILKCANAKEQSSQKMEEKLAFAGFSPQASEAAMSRAICASIISDERYADCLIRSTLAQGKGLERILAEIEALDVNVEDLDAYQEYVQDVSPTMEERAIRYLEKHPTQAKDAYSACMRKLLNRGYSTDVASHATKAYLASHG